jgi:hypothetical protein
MILVRAARHRLEKEYPGLTFERRGLRRSIASGYRDTFDHARESRDPRQWLFAPIHGLLVGLIWWALGEPAG